MDEQIGKKIMAGEPIITFTTNEVVKWSKRRNVGVIEEVTDQEVKVFHIKNPLGYQHYTLKRSDFDRWVTDKLYVLK